MKEIKNVTTMLGATLSKEEVEEFMKEADVVRRQKNFYSRIMMIFVTGWKWKVGL